MPTRLPGVPAMNLNSGEGATTLSIDLTGFTEPVTSWPTSCSQN